MAMITCEGCGAEISDKATKCPKCGYELKKESEKKSLPKISKKVWIIIGCIVGVIITGFVGLKIVQAINESKMEPSDEYVLSCVEKLRGEKGKILLENDILYSVNKNGKTYVIIEFSSSDGREMAYFEDKVFVGTDTDYARIKNRDYDDVKAGRITEDEYKRILEKKISFATGDMEVAGWNLMAKMGSGGSESTHLVSAKKIGKKLGISYPKD